MEPNENVGDQRDGPLESNEWRSVLQLLGTDKQAAALNAEDITTKTLPTVEMWEAFYKLYSHQIGFAYRKNEVKRDTNGTIISRRYTCSREGYRRSDRSAVEQSRRLKRPETRCGCTATLRVRFKPDYTGWVATDFISQHNHECVCPDEVRYLSQNRIVSNDVVAACSSMKRAGMKTCHIIDFIAMEVGGHSRLPFIRKDVYNTLDNRARTDDRNNLTDSHGALGYLQCLANQNGGDFSCVYNVDDDNRLCNIFWADRTSKLDYSLFGDVIAFDTTYRTNKYNKPLMIVVGVNHHYRTCVYGHALLHDETVESFVWVLQNFLQAMNNIPPKVVITDGDHSMRNAINQVFPGTKHRLCSWHILENATRNVHDKGFNNALCPLIYDFFTDDEFVTRWTALISAYGLTNSNWAMSLFEKRHSWAETYLRGTFFAGMRSTQRSESANGVIRRYLDKTKSLKDFVACIDFSVARTRQQEAQDDFQTKHTSPVLPHRDILLPYYKQASKLFTRAMYKKVELQLQQHNAYSVSLEDQQQQTDSFSITKFQRRDTHYSITVHKNNNDHMTCSCKLFQSYGYPCRHIFAVMKFINCPTIPESLIMSRWTITAKSHLPNQSTTHDGVSSELMEMARYGTLSSSFNRLAYFSIKDPVVYERTRQELLRLLSVVEAEVGSTQMSPTPNMTTSPPRSHNHHPHIVRDPAIVRTKGTANQRTQRSCPVGGSSQVDGRRRCSMCQGHGHNKQTCPSRPTHVSSTNRTDGDIPVEQLPTQPIPCDSHSVEHYGTYGYHHEYEESMHNSSPTAATQHFHTDFSLSQD